MVDYRNPGFIIEKNFGKRKAYIQQITAMLDNIRVLYRTNLKRTIDKIISTSISKEALDNYRLGKVTENIRYILSGRSSQIKAALIFFENYLSTVEKMSKEAVKRFDYSNYEKYIEESYEKDVNSFPFGIKFKYELKKSFSGDSKKELSEHDEVLDALFAALRNNMEIFKKSLGAVGIDTLVDLNFNADKSKLVALSDAYVDNQLLKTKTLNLKLVPELLDERAAQAVDIFGDGAAVFVLTYLESLYLSCDELFRNPAEDDGSNSFYKNLFDYIEINTDYFMDKVDAIEDFDYMNTYKAIYNFDVSKKSDEIRDQLLLIRDKKN